jgi:hypothetical protein
MIEQVNGEYTKEKINGRLKRVSQNVYNDVDTVANPA